ncbi:MAG: DNA polymerase III subunit beta [Aquificaceae bacterium]|nr:DNA polymerase III subunit beta [Aquificaceae bacterium]MDW8066724.1 DNA polymerase III subunit beta [Aquificaceae bacterium]MDW8422913.1 DNA polymerase III subunit beta [Aquificaceae bacterium]
MKLKIDREEFLSALQKAKNATEKKSALPILNNFLLEVEGGRLQLRATDLENFLSLDLPAQVEEEGKVATNADKLTNIVKSLPSATVSLEWKEDKLVVSGGRSTFKLSTIDPEDFPEFPQPSTSAHFPALDLLKAIDKVEYAISKDDARYALQGLYVHEVDGKTHFVGSDGHRLALFWKRGNFPMELLVPRKSLRVIQGLLKDYFGQVHCGKDESFAHLTGEDWRLAIRLLEGEYPDYMSVIPTSFNYDILVQRDSLLESLKRLSAIAESSAFPVKITFSENMAILEISDPEYGEGRDELDVDYNGEALEVGFNGRYLIEALDSFDVDTIWMKVVDPDSPVVLESNDEEKDPYLCVVMPMRL